MEPLRSYLAEVQSATASEFEARHPYPFLVHSGAPLRPIDQTRGLTFDRLVLEGDSGEGVPSPQMRDTFSALPVRGREDRRLITIGLSSSCDLVVKDASLSKVHGWFDRVEDTWRIWDNDSAATTQVNGRVVAPGKGQPLESGDRITLGYVDLTFLEPQAFFRLVRGLF